MAPLADAPVARWWVDRSGQTVAGVVLVVAVAAWAMMLTLPTMQMPGMGQAMSAMPPAPMTAPSGGMSMSISVHTPVSLNWADLGAFTAAWALMMGAMMLPSATPMIALYSTVARRRDPGATAARTTMFAVSYAAVWALSGIVVYALSLAIEALVESHRWAHDAAPYAAAGTLLAAGAYQFTPLKRMCLANCRNPLTFLVAHWRPGLAGAARIGFAHAAFCFGCCSLLMVVLVAAGAMGLAWVLLIGAAVALEKLVSRWPASPALSGIALLALGVVAALHPSLISHLRS